MSFHIIIHVSAELRIWDKATPFGTQTSSQSKLTLAFSNQLNARGNYIVGFKTFTSEQMQPALIQLISTYYP